MSLHPLHPDLSTRKMYAQTSKQQRINPITHIQATKKLKKKQITKLKKNYIKPLTNAAKIDSEFEVDYLLSFFPIFYLHAV